MKLSKIILEGPLEYDPDFNREIDKIQDQGGKYIGSGDYGSVYLLNGKAVKVSTDSVELDHAEKLVGKKTNNFVYIFDAPFKYWAREIVWKIASNADAFFAFTNCVYVKAQYISIDKIKAFYIFKSFF